MVSYGHGEGPLIEVSKVGKRYQKLSEYSTLLRSVLPWTRPRRTEHWALRDLNFRVESGELVGVIGHNGAGKTTLLRLLAGVTAPTCGDVRVVGRIAPLISIGVGFHQELTGRENVHINGMLLGLSARETAERFDSIVDFAEMWDFIDTPVKFYSSGMTLRLGFGVVTHIDPTILLVDEILAVGDAGFQLKCLNRLSQFRDDGAAILMVSHALTQVRELCSRVILIRHGVAEFDGDPETAISLHETLADSAPGADTHDLGAVEIVDVRFVDVSGEVEEPCFEYEQPVDVVMRLRFTRAVEDPQIRVGIRSAEAGFVGVNATEAGTRWRCFAEGEECEMRVSFAARIAGGRYKLAFAVRERDGGGILGRYDGPWLRVANRQGVSGIADLSTTVSLGRL